MASDSVVLRSFASGELAPSVYARADLPQYLTGLRECRNFIVKRRGGVTNRPGTKFVAECKLEGACYIYPFRFPGAGESYVLEMGELYLRFHKEGAAVMDGLSPKEIVTPYGVGVHTPTAPICVEQNGLSVTFTNLSFVPYELEWTGAGGLSWTFLPIVFGAWNAGPAGGAGVAGVAGTRTYQYVVTAVRDDDTREEGRPSAVITIATAGVPTKEAPHVLTWTAVTGAAEYYVYGDAGDANGDFGFMGVAKTNAFKDTEFVPDYGSTPPIAKTRFAGANFYPALNAVYQQRKVYGGAHDNRSTVHTSRTGIETNFDIRSPIQDDDAVTFTIKGQYAQVLFHMIATQLGLVLLTDEGEWLVDGDAQGAITPTAIQARQHGWAGAACEPKPLVIGQDVLFVQARSNQVRRSRYNEQINGLTGFDLSMYADHLFEGFTIKRWAFQLTPDAVVWAVRDDGVLLGMTYIRDEDVWGWHQHDTADGFVEDVCVIPEGDEDAVYLVVRREGGFGTKRYIERLEARHDDAIADAFFVDCGITYDGAATTAIDGLDHLEGLEVVANADGVAVGPFTVLDGAITLATAARLVHVGLPITCQLKTLALDVNGSSARDKRKALKALSLLLDKSARGFEVGPTVDDLKTVTASPWDSDEALLTGLVELEVTSHFTDSGELVVRHTSPLPLTINALVPFVEVGG
jgi:hypothetical protein